MKKLFIYSLGIIAFGILLSQTIPPQQEKEPAVKLTVNEWAVVLSGVAKLPLETSQNIYMKIITQVNQQLDTVKTKK
jgi:hypothetical protein